MQTKNEHIAVFVSVAYGRLGRFMLTPGVTAPGSHIEDAFIAAKHPSFQAFKNTYPSLVDPIIFLNYGLN